MVESLFVLCCPVSPLWTVKWPIMAIGFFAMIVGATFYRNPEKAIQFQIEFYRRINWRMEPINLKKEIRNTRAMGLLSLFCGLAALLILFVRCR